MRSAKERSDSVGVNVTPEQFDRAFTEFQLFGPRRRIPIEEP